MATTVRVVDYFTTTIPDKPGEGAHVLQALAGEGVNLLAFTGFPRGRRAQLDFMPEDTAALKAAARRLGFTLSARKTAFLVQGDDRPGAIAKLAARLADRGINVIAVDAASSGKGRYSAILWVKPEDVTRAKRALNAR